MLPGNPWDPKDWSVEPEPVYCSDELPFITLGVLSYNRRDELRQTLDVLLNAVRYPRYEVIVVDNGSIDGSSEMVATEFPSVQLIRMPTNIGVAARNLQATYAKGKYLFSFDDDSYPASPSTVYQVVTFMECNPDIHVISTDCYRPLSGILETSGWDSYRFYCDDARGYSGMYLAEGAACFRVETLRRVDGYEPKFIRGKEGVDLCLQFYKLNVETWLCPQFATLHLYTPTSRSAQTIWYYESRHTMWVLGKHWPMILVPVIGFFWLLRRIAGAFLHPDTATAVARGYWDGIRGIGPFLARRPKLTWTQAFKLRRFYLQLLRW